MFWPVHWQQWLQHLPVPVSNSVVHAEESQDRSELKLRYTSAAPDSYDGWEKWSLPIGNSGIGASVFGGVQTERIQLNEKSLWSGGPSESRPDYNGGNLEEKRKKRTDSKKRFSNCLLMGTMMQQAVSVETGRF